VAVQVELIVFDPVAVDQAQLPAAAVVLEAAEGLEGAALVVVVLPAGDGAPLRYQRPDHREVVLVDLVLVAAELELAGTRVEALGVVAIAVAGIDDLARLGFRLV